MSVSSIPQTEQHVLIRRTFNAPRALVFAAWLDPMQLTQWYGPTGCTIEFRHLDPRPGGTFHSCIHTPTGYACWCIGTYLEIVKPDRIVFTMQVADADGRPADPAATGMDPEWPRETTVTVTFADLIGKTEMTLSQSVSESLAKRTGAYPSWLNMFDRLEAIL